jgi:HSP20 family protein
MQKEKRSFFERLTGAIKINEESLDMEDTTSDELVESKEEDESEGQLVVDVHQTHSDIVIKTMVPGVRPEDLDISITRDMVTIKGKREAERNVNEEDYFHRELYWGIFSRTIVLPQEIDVEGAEAVERHGLLIIKLPKLDKNRQTKLKVRNNG